MIPYCPGAPLVVSPPLVLPPISAFSSVSISAAYQCPSLQPH
ncbi:unnamed protein product [Staurois parvus]|uniref:Uncharacterized protein n=1 Tax=Staurois parvus TaxID=386267 RepID=A0ABN9B970_9NEOB|nr:unnamed protein product [Staurois parvus]